MGSTWNTSTRIQYQSLAEDERPTRAGSSLARLISQVQTGDWTGLFALARKATSLERVDKLYALQAYACVVHSWRSSGPKSLDQVLMTDA